MTVLAVDRRVTKLPDRSHDEAASGWLQGEMAALVLELGLQDRDRLAGLPGTPVGGELDRGEQDALRAVASVGVEDRELVAVQLQGRVAHRGGEEGRALFEAGQAVFGTVH